jgi:hypothetical protein
VEVLVAILLVVAFFIGPLKLIGAGWLGYLLPDALTILTLLLVFVERAMRRAPMFAASPLTIAILLIGFVSVLQLANPASPFVRSVLGLRTWALYLGFFFVGLHAFRSRRQVESLYALLLVLGCVTAAYGVIQWRAGPEAFASWSEEYGRYARTLWSAGLFRAFSTFVLPNVFGANMGLLMLIAYCVAASSSIPMVWRVAAGGAFALMGAGIAASGTRASVVELFIAGAIGFTLLPGRLRRLRLGVTGLVLSLAAVSLVLAAVGPGIGVRFVSILDPNEFFWKWFDPLIRGVRIALAHPFGMGLGYTGGVPRFLNSPGLSDLPTTVIDSGYGAAAAELGLVGLGVFVYFAVKVGLEGVRAWGRLVPGRLRDLMLAPALYAALYPIVAVLGGTHASLPSSIYYWLMIGTLIRVSVLQKERNANQVSAAEVHPG